MRTGSAARRERLFQSLPPERKSRVRDLRKMIEDNAYILDGKIELVADELIEEAVRLRG